MCANERTERTNGTDGNKWANGEVQKKCANFIWPTRDKGIENPEFEFPGARPRKTNGYKNWERVIEKPNHLASRICSWLCSPKRAVQQRKLPPPYQKKKVKLVWFPRSVTVHSFPFFVFPHSSNVLIRKSFLCIPNVQLLRIAYHSFLHSPASSYIYIRMMKMVHSAYSIWRGVIGLQHNYA